MDTSWIEEFEKNDELYSDFYKSEVETIKITYIYVNENNEIVHVNRDSVILANKGVLSKQHLIYLLRTNNKLYTQKYKLLSLLQFNYDYEPNELINSIKDDCQMDNNLKSHHYINDVIWNPTINFMHDLNSLYVIYYYDKYNKVTANTTRKIRLLTQSDNKKSRKRT